MATPMPKPGGIFNSPFVASSMIGGVINLYVSEKNRQQQRQIHEENQKLSIETESNRQNFQLDLNERNAQLQRELSQKNHLLRLQEIEKSFENTCKQAQWQRFLATWPLVNIPEVIRQEQCLADDTVALRIIFSKSNDAIFAQTVFPLVEEGLRQFM